MILMQNVTFAMSAADVTNFTVVTVSVGLLLELFYVEHKQVEWYKLCS